MYTSLCEFYLVALLSKQFILHYVVALVTCACGLHLRTSTKWAYWAVAVRSFWSWSAMREAVGSYLLPQFWSSLHKISNLRTRTQFPHNHLCNPEAHRFNVEVLCIGMALFTGSQQVRTWYPRSRATGFISGLLPSYIMYLTQRLFLIVLNHIYVPSLSLI